MKSLVINMHRCSVHDGPGVRTSVFLKGCPLRCQWCHNPESLSFKKQLSFNQSTCQDCLACTTVCEHEVHSQVDGRHVVNLDNCISCGKCVAVCGQRSLSVIGEEKTVDDIMKVIKKDKIYYDSTGGGVTISGGEVLSHREMASGILKACKSANIHTCLETSGFGRRDVVEALLPDVDLVLFDYKVTGEADHIKYTGVSNQIILENLDYIYQQGTPIVLRCPIIPTVNNYASHFEAIDTLLSKYPNILKAELLPYHNFGVSKGKNIAYEHVKVFEMPTEEEKSTWLTFFKQNAHKVSLN